MITGLVQSGNNLTVTEKDGEFSIEDFFLNSKNEILGKLPNGEDLTWIEAKIAFADQLITDANALTTMFTGFEVKFDDLNQDHLTQNIQQSILELPDIITLAVYTDIEFLGEWTKTVWDEVGYNDLPWGTDEDKGLPTKVPGGVTVEDQINNDGFILDTEVDMNKPRLFTVSNDTVDFTTQNPDAYREGTQYYGDSGNDTVQLGTVDEMGAWNWTSFENNRGDVGNAFSAGAGDDIVYGSSDVDTIYGNTGNDSLFGNDGDDELHGMDGDDKLHGGNGDDLLIGHNGNDKLHGGNGDDELHGFEGNDLVKGDAGHDHIKGNQGNDMLYGGTGEDDIYGNSGDDYAEGNEGNDRLFGGDGNDVLYGNGPDTDNGTIETRTPFSGEAGSLDPTKDMKTFWENGDVKLYSLEFGETLSKENFDSDNLLFNKNGVGVKEDGENNDAIGNQITYNAETGESQSLVLEFPDGTNKATVAFSNLFENEGSFTEVGKYEVYDKDLTLLGYKTFIADENKNVGNVEIDLGETFKYIRFYAEPYEGEGKERVGDNSDYFVRHVSYEGEIVEIDVPPSIDDNDEVYGEAGDDLVFGNGGDDYVAGGLGSDKVYGGSGNDKGVADLTDGKLNEYHGDTGYDILDLKLTAQQLADIEVIKDIMSLKKFLADTSDISKDNITGETQYFEKLNLKVSTWEELKVNGEDFENPNTDVEKQQVFSIEVFDGEAGYQNSFGFFDSTNEGKLVYANVKEAVGKEPVVIEVDDPKSVEFFILPNGNRKHDINDMDNVVVDSDRGEITVGSEILKMGKDAYFSDPSKNDNQEIRVINNEAEGSLNWEDLPNLGDKDYDDVNIQATLETTITGSDLDDTFVLEPSGNLYTSKTWINGGEGNDTVDLSSSGGWTMSDSNGIVDPVNFMGQDVNIMFNNGDELYLKEVENVVWG